MLFLILFSYVLLCDFSKVNLGPNTWLFFQYFTNESSTSINPITADFNNTQLNIILYENNNNTATNLGLAISIPEIILIIWVITITLDEIRLVI